MKEVINPSPRAQIEQVSWHEIKEQVQLVNPELAVIIDELPAKSLKFTLGCYSYGADIANGLAHKDPPVFLVLDKACEVYFEYEDQPMMYDLIKRGEIGFADHVADNIGFSWHHKLWRISSGARNVFMLPKISDYEKHQKLEKHFNFEVNKPLYISEQAQVFQLIANSEKNKEDWQARVLFFGNEWMSHKHDKRWSAFYSYLALQALKKSRFEKAQFIYNIVVGALQKTKPIKLSLPQIEQVNHVLMLVLNGVPGFTVMHNDDLMPTRLIQEVYQDVYRLENYAPIIMGPDYFDFVSQQAKALYYSLNYPCFYQFSPRKNNSMTTAKEFSQLAWVLEKILSFIQSWDGLNETSSLSQFAKNHAFNFCHHGSVHDDFKTSSVINAEDASLMQGWSNGLKFPEKTSFFNGCIQIKRLGNK